MGKPTNNDTNRFRRLLAQGNVCLGDGAMGTRLHEMTGRSMACPEALVLEADGRDILGKVHAEYIAAGAQWIETHTFGANAWRLQSEDMQEHCAAINRLAAETALAAAAPHDVAVLGSVGPLDRQAAGGSPSIESLQVFYQPQIQALADAGVDGLQLETFARLNEAEAALRCAVSVDLPIVFAIGGQRVARAFARRGVIDLVRLADKFGVSAIGLNCLPPYDISRLLPLLLDNTARPLLCMPNAGSPQVIRGSISYDLPADDLARETDHWISQGVSMIGGCCGTRSEHIRVLASKMHDRPITRRAMTTGSGGPAAAAVTVGEKQRIAALDQNQPIRRILREATRPLIAVEIRPALQRPFPDTIERLKPVIDAAPDLFDIPDNPGANPGRSSLVCAGLLEQVGRIPVIAHCNPSQANALRLTADLLSAADLGVGGVLAVSGDPPHIGPFDRHATRINDVRNAVELLQMLSLMRQGEMINGQPLPTPIDFCCGCALAPALSLKSQIAWLEKKIEAGAEYVFTQPVFDIPTVERLRDALPAQIQVPVFLGIFPIISARQAAFLQAGKIPGIVLPDANAAAIMRFEQSEDQMAAGLEQTEAMLDALRSEADGLYLIMPFHSRSESITASLVRRIRQADQTRH